jgi:hypothetical protein
LVFDTLYGLAEADRDFAAKQQMVTGHSIEAMTAFAMYNSMAARELWSMRVATHCLKQNPGAIPDRLLGPPSIHNVVRNQHIVMYSAKPKWADRRQSLP